MCFALTKMQFMCTRLPQIVVCDIDCVRYRAGGVRGKLPPHIWPGPPRPNYWPHQYFSLFAASFIIQARRT